MLKDTGVLQGPEKIIKHIQFMSFLVKSIISSIIARRRWNIFPLLQCWITVMNVHVHFIFLTTLKGGEGGKNHS